MDDIELTYDIKPFKNAMNEMTQAFNKFTKNMQSGQDTTAKKTVQRTKLVGASMAKLAVIGTMLYGVFRLIKRALAEIPEIGQTFKAAGNIILKNLLWPLRIQLIPLLQKIMDWVRDNRSLFIQWGYVIANIFKAIGQVISAMWNLIKSFTRGFKKEIGDAMNFTVRGILDVINLAIFKITALIMLLSIKLQPIADTLGTIFALLLKDIWAFAEGFGGAILSMLEKMKIWQDIVTVFEELKNLLELINPEWIKTIGKAFALFYIPLIVGLKVSVALLRSLVGLLRVAGDSSFSMKDYGKMMKEAWWENMIPENVRKGLGDAGASFQDYANKQVQPDITNTEDQRLKLDPNTLGTYNQRDNNTSYNINIENIDTKDDAVKAGNEVGKSIHDELYKSLLDQNALWGGK